MRLGNCKRRSQITEDRIQNIGVGLQCGAGVPARAWIALRAAEGETVSQLPRAVILLRFEMSWRGVACDALVIEANKSFLGHWRSAGSRKRLPSKFSRASGTGCQTHSEPHLQAKIECPERRASFVV
jgi:hypothetical protein